MSARRRGSARQAKHAERAQAVADNPIPAGLEGGRYLPLADAEVVRIHEGAMSILEEVGLGESPPELVEPATERGAVLGDDGRLRMPRALVEEMIEVAAHEFVLHGRDERHDLELGGDRVHFGTGGAAVNVLDFESGHYRESTLLDLYDFTRLADQLPNVHWFTRCVIATEHQDPYELDINTAYALVAGTSKHTGTAITMPENVDPVIALFDIAGGGEGSFRARPFTKLHTSPIVPPLRWGPDACDTMVAGVRAGMPINAITAGISGATTPASLAGTLVQTVAETLAALVFVNLLSPGHPFIFSNWPFATDLRTGAMVGGSPEVSVLNAASAQVAKYYGIPSGVAAGMADSKVPDVQAGYEKGITTSMAALAGANMIYESSGMLASLLSASFEMFVIDDELLGSSLRATKGIEVSDDTLSVDLIREVVEGPGHFLGTDQTLTVMESEYIYPSIGDRLTPEEWEETGRSDAWQRARLRVTELMGNHPEYLSASQDDEIRSRFDIALDPTDMAAETHRWG